MSLNSNRLRLSRNAWIGYLLIDLALFLLANFTAKSASHQGVVSQIFFFPFIAGLAVAALLGITELVRSRRS